MASKRQISFLIALSFLVVGCSVSLQTERPTTSAPFLITATLAPTPTRRPTGTLPPPSPSPTDVPVSGTTSTQLNVRAEPSTASLVLGIIPADTTVQIVGQDPAGQWWQIIHEAGVDGKGWVTAQYVRTAGQPEVPVIGGDKTNSGSGNSAVVIQQLNIRSGPGTSFQSLGILNANDVVTLSGRNSDGSWLQIEFSSGSDGTGWVNASFVKAAKTDDLPIVSALGEIVGTGIPLDTLPAPTPTRVPAATDNDTAESPQKTVQFDRAGTNTLIYNGDVSAPIGDAEDWIAVTTYGDVLFAQIECTGSNTLRVNIAGSGTILVCNDTLKPFSVQSGTSLLVHIQAVPSSDALEYTRYLLTIKASQ